MIETLPVDRLDEARPLRAQLHHHHVRLGIPAGYAARDEAAAWRGWRSQAQALLQADAGEVFVHRALDGRPTGLAQVRVVPADKAVRPVLTPTGDHAELVVLVVADDVRSTGVGGRLYAAALDWARARSAVAMQIHVRGSNTDALRFYDRHGAAPAFVELMHPL